MYIPLEGLKVSWVGKIPIHWSPRSRSSTWRRRWCRNASASWVWALGNRGPRWHAVCSCRAWPRLPPGFGHTCFSPPPAKAGRHRTIAVGCHGRRGASRRLGSLPPSRGLPIHEHRFDKHRFGSIQHPHSGPLQHCARIPLCFQAGGGHRCCHRYWLHASSCPARKNLVRWIPSNFNLPLKHSSVLNYSKSLTHLEHQKVTSVVTHSKWGT